MPVALVRNGTGPGLPDLVVSPVTLSEAWPRLARLILLAALATLGSVGNVFMISAVMIDDYLRRRGNTFIVNIALADLLISGLVVPASAVAILAGLKECSSICKFQWYLVTLCFLVTVLFSLATSAENYIRLCCSQAVYERLTKTKIIVSLVLLWAGCSITSGLQFVPGLSFNYCKREFSGILHYQTAIGVIFVFLPIFFTFFLFLRTIFGIKSAKLRPSFKPQITFNWDCSLMNTNFYSFLLFLAFWLPYGVILAVSAQRRIADGPFYHLAWLGMTKSCVNNLVYCVTNRHFRGAYVNLFHYCCCKTTVTFSRRQRPEAVRPSGDVRVHIIPGYNMYTSPQRAREGQSKRCVTRQNGREVYEL